jgi:hypothetical protein
MVRARGGRWAEHPAVARLELAQLVLRGSPPCQTRHTCTVCSLQGLGGLPLKVITSEGNASFYELGNMGASLQTTLPRCPPDPRLICSMYGSIHTPPCKMHTVFMY